MGSCRHVMHGARCQRDPCHDERVMKLRTTSIHIFTTYNHATDSKYNMICLLSRETPISTTHQYCRSSRRALHVCKSPEPNEQGLSLGEVCEEESLGVTQPVA